MAEICQQKQSKRIHPGLAMLTPYEIMWTSQARSGFQQISSINSCDFRLYRWLSWRFEFQSSQNRISIKKKLTSFFNICGSNTKFPNTQTWTRKNLPDLKPICPEALKGLLINIFSKVRLVSGSPPTARLLSRFLTLDGLVALVKITPAVVAPRHQSQFLGEKKQQLVAQHHGSRSF